MLNLLRFTMLTLTLCSAGQAATSTSPAVHPGQVFREAATGTLFAAQQGNGIDFNLWFDPAGPKAPRLILSRAALPATNLIVGADFGKGNTVYALVQRELTRQRSEQDVFALDRVYGTRTMLFRLSTLGLQTAVGESFRYDPSTDRVVFTASKAARINGQVGMVSSTYSYGPLASKTRTLLKIQ